MAAQNPQPAKKTPKRVRFNLPSDDKVGLEKPENNEINKPR